MRRQQPDLQVFMRQHRRQTAGQHLRLCAAHQKADFSSRVHHFHQLRRKLPQVFHVPRRARHAPLVHQHQRRRLLLGSREAEQLQKRVAPPLQAAVHVHLRAVQLSAFPHGHMQRRGRQHLPHQKAAQALRQPPRGAGVPSGYSFSITSVSFAPLFGSRASATKYSTMPSKCGDSGRKGRDPVFHLLTLVCATYRYSPGPRGLRPARPSGTPAAFAVCSSCAYYIPDTGPGQAESGKFLSNQFIWQIRSVLDSSLYE